jgi:hypothetical protein
VDEIAQMTTKTVYRRTTTGKTGPVLRVRFLPLIYLVVGVIVAYSENYFENVGQTKRLISAVLAVVLWPLVLVGFDITIT